VITVVGEEWVGDFVQKSRQNRLVAMDAARVGIWRPESREAALNAYTVLQLEKRRAVGGVRGFVRTSRDANDISRQLILRYDMTPPSSSVPTGIETP
jgi:hypothetical protein